MALARGDILYDREPDGRIVEIVRRFSTGTILIGLIFMIAFLAAGWMMMAMAHAEAARPLHSIQYMGIGVASVGVGLWMAGRQLYLFVQGKSRFFTIADESGLHFRFYDAFKNIPWDMVESFDLVPSPVEMLGHTLLVVQLKNPDQYRRLINPNGPLSSKLPFATLECSDEFLNLAPVREALIEMKSQMARA